MRIFCLLLIFKATFCDWVSEWLAPVEYQLRDLTTQNISNSNVFQNSRGLEIAEETVYVPFQSAQVEAIAPAPTSASIILKLKEILENAKVLTNTLKKYIFNIENRERNLKEAIASGRSGITILVVTTLTRAPRIYFIRNGFWTLCNGIVQYPVTDQPYNVFTEIFSTPRCIGQEITSRRDECAFHSLIKYETIPTTKRSPYIEDDYLCLKPTFNYTLETFMSVPRRVIDETCKNGLIKNLSENVLDCGLRVVLEYTYYPNKSETSWLPLEYCNEKDGACKLLIGWHLSNKTIENFEFLKKDDDFRRFFLNNKQCPECFK